METTGELRTTVLHDLHRQAGARLVPFAGFEMPVQYTSILDEHLATRKGAGLFDISHMGRFLFSGDPVPPLQYLLTNNVNALHEVGMAQYTLIPNEQGEAIDDAYLYRTGPEEFMLVVNASNREKDWAHLSQHFPRFPDLQARDVTEEIAMLALQGPNSERIMAELLQTGANRGLLPENERNRLSTVRIEGVDVIVSRTGYTGEPVGFELFLPASRAPALWEQILTLGRRHEAVPVGLGARDTLRLEAGYPLYGHELGIGPDGKAIPIFALSMGRAATRFDEGKGEFLGKEALHAQYREVREVLRGMPPRPWEDRLVPRLIWPLAVLNPSHTAPGQNPPRQGNEVYRAGRPVGWVTSGSTVPNWCFSGAGLLSCQGSEEARRAIGLAYVDAGILPGEFGQPVEVVKANSPQPIPALLVKANLRPAPPYARPVIHPEQPREASVAIPRAGERLLAGLVKRSVETTIGRQRGMVNLIPSEQTPSLVVRLLSILDPAGRYAEHNRVEALAKSAEDIFHYQGTGFIRTVEADVQGFFRGFLGCREVEARPISGQMANHCVFRGLVDYHNRFRKEEPLRLRQVMVNSLRRGGHLSAQMLGALKNQVARDPRTGRAAVCSFPVMQDNPYRIDVEATRELIDRYDPQLLVFGKSLVLHREPIKEIAEFVRERDTFIMYDMAHVLGLVGPHFQEPFKEGAHLVTGSTHKTFFGTQRGVIASNMSEDTELWPLWEGIVSAAFPGSMSNHHPGTLLGLLGSCYEMMEFGDAYQRQVLANARAFALALAELGLAVEGDPSMGYTETHQVVLRVGKGPEVADRLERNNLVVNSQTLPSDPSVTSASGVRLGVQEMTRFGVKEEGFRELAGYLAEIMAGKELAEQVAAFRSRYTEMQYCFSGERASEMVRELADAAGLSA